MKQCHHGYYVADDIDESDTCPHGCSIPTPCPSCPALRAELEVSLAYGVSEHKACAEKDAELTRLREAVEWILMRHDTGVMHPVHDWVELRRRAKEGK